MPYKTNAQIGTRISHQAAYRLHHDLKQKLATATHQLRHLQRKLTVQKLGVRVHILQVAHLELWV